MFKISKFFIEKLICGPEKSWDFWKIDSFSNTLIRCKIWNFVSIRRLPPTDPLRGVIAIKWPGCPQKMHLEASGHRIRECKIVLQIMPIFILLEINVCLGHPNPRKQDVRQEFSVFKRKPDISDCTQKLHYDAFGMILLWKHSCKYSMGGSPRGTELIRSFTKFPIRL